MCLYIFVDLLRFQLKKETYETPEQPKHDSTLRKMAADACRIISNYRYNIVDR